MVTILETRTDTEPNLELVMAPVQLREGNHPRVGYLEMRYAMPFAGVRYYAFRPSNEASPKPVGPGEHVPVPLAAQLIDERVILL